jgi:hypothetical protein
MKEQKLSLNDVVRAAEQRTHLLYEGEVVAHRSCGISLAETFGRETKPYQSLRRGGITGEGQCGAIKAGELILGEIYGDPDPRGGVTDSLKEAIRRYNRLWKERVDKGESDSIICNDLTGQFDEFHSESRHQFCTDIASTVSGCIAQVMVEMGTEVELPPEPTE